MSDAIRSGFTRFHDFSGRSGRSEFWLFQLTGVGAGILAASADFLVFHEFVQAGWVAPISFTVTTGWFLLSVPIAVRRLHDTGHSGRWMVAIIGLVVWPNFIFAILSILVVVWLCMRGTDGPNHYGETVTPHFPEDSAASPKRKD